MKTSLRFLKGLIEGGILASHQFIISCMYDSWVDVRESLSKGQEDGCDLKQSCVGLRYEEEV